MNIELLSYTDNAIDVMAEIAKISHGGKSKKSNEKLMRDIMKWGHYSVLEHAYATFKISGISRACSHQLVRHRHLSFLQESQRYVKVEDNDFYIMPDSFKGDMEVEASFKVYLDDMKHIYNLMIDKGIKKEDARFILPNATKTCIVVTGNFRAWREFIQKRIKNEAQWEIRKVAEYIKEMLSSITEEFLWM